MGYSTDFSGAFDITPPLTPEHTAYLRKFNDTRRMKRHVDPKYGQEGEFYVLGEGFHGQGLDGNVINQNAAPGSQPGLWCQWVPSEDGRELGWDEGEKFYEYIPWLTYLIGRFFKPLGYTLNGVVTWQGEEPDDRGRIVVQENVVTTQAPIFAWGDAEHHEVEVGPAPSDEVIREAVGATDAAGPGTPTQSTPSTTHCS